MQRFKVLMLALFAIFALGVTIVGTASAVLPTLLNAKKELVKSEKFSGTNEVPTTLTTLKENGSITCKKNVAEGTLEEKEVLKGVFGYLGPVHIMFEKCKASELGFEGPCTGQEELKETILVLGEIHLVFDSLSPLGAAILFLINKVHFTCEVLGVKVLFLVSGQLLCLITPLTLSKEFTISCKKGKEAGDPGETVYWNDEGKEVSIPNGLEVQRNEGAISMGAQEGEVKVKTELEVEIMD